MPKCDFNKVALKSHVGMGVLRIKLAELINALK